MKSFKEWNVTKDQLKILGKANVSEWIEDDPLNKKKIILMIEGEKYIYKVRVKEGIRNG